MQSIDKENLKFMSTVPKWRLGDRFNVVATQCKPRECRKVFGDLEGECGQEVVCQAEGKYRGW